MSPSKVLVKTTMDQFDTTQWSLVLAAGQQTSKESAKALSELCQRYWLPLYGYVRRRVADVHEAQDLTQEFFCRVLERDFFANATPERGRFRAFLLTSLKHFLTNEWQKARARKRGGGKKIFSMNFEDGESRLSCVAVDEMTPEKQFDRQWAVAMLERVLQQLRQEARQTATEAKFEVLKTFLAGGREAAEAHAAAGRKLRMTPDAVKVAAHRLRQRHRELLRAEIAATVARSADINDEVRDLFQVLGS